MKHEHIFSKVVANRPGLATLQCGCGKRTLVTYDNVGQFTDLLLGFKERRDTIKQHYETLAMKLTALKHMGFRRGEVAQLAQEVPA